MLVTTHASAAPLTIDIRPARMDDVYPILGLHREAFADKFGAAFGASGAARGIEAMAEAWRRQGANALRGMLVAVADGQVIGTITLRTWEMGSDNSGAAQALLARTEEDGRIRRKRFLGLYVSAANQAARQLYLRAGFTEHHKR